MAGRAATGGDLFDLLKGMHRDGDEDPNHDQMALAIERSNDE